MNFLKLASRGRNACGSMRQFCIDARPVTAELQPDIHEQMEKEVYKPRRHPGVMKPRWISLPEHLVKGIRKCLDGSNMKQLNKESKKHANYLRSRHSPIERNEMFNKQRKIKNEVMHELQLSKATLNEVDLEIADDLRNKINTEVLRLVKTKTFNWVPINYDQPRCLVHLAARAAQDYAVVHKIFLEIAQRHPDFTPRSFFDFGAGVGTGTWAASSLWKESLYEYFSVDSSRDMNDLADLILRDGVENKHRSLKNVYFRQNLPSSNEAKFDVVLCAYTLMELENQKKRLETLLSLWNKCHSYLVLVEQGTNAGFKLINEARDFILDVSKNEAHVFAPCPHDVACPRYTANDGTPCNFEVLYTPLNIIEPQPTKTELYSYIVLKKGPRPENEPDVNWPRVVRPTMVRTQHAICKLCTSRGQLEHVVFSKCRHSKYTYRCGRVSNWGDRLPIVLAENDDIESETQ